MEESIQDETYVFVSWKGSKPSQDPNVQALIRRRAMKHNAAIRKRNGGYGKHNVRQVPVWLMEPEVPEEDPASRAILHGYGNEDSQRTQIAASMETMWGLGDFWHTSIAPAPPADPFIAGISAKYSLLNLVGPLTMLHLGVSKLSYFEPHYSCVGRTLSQMPAYLQSRRLISFIPSRYGRVTSITHAADCLVARLGQIVRANRRWSSDRDAATLKSYAKALRSLQEAIDDDGLRMKPETLCAAELLGLFELLSGKPEVKTWMRHAGGVGRLIELRGPDRFQTDFELSLFMTFAGPIITEASFNGKTCFLGEERWQQIIHAAIRNDPLVPQDQAHLVIDLWDRLGKGPNLFKETADLVLFPMLASSEARENLIRRLLEEQEHLKEWLISAQQYQYGADYKWQGLTHGAAALLRSYKFSKASAEQPVTWRILQGTYLVCCFVKSRALFALSPSRFPGLEARCQALAREVVSLTVDYPVYEEERLMGGLFMSEIIWMAEAIIETREVWSAGSLETCCEANQKDSGMIERWKFEAWSKTLLRKVL